MHYITDDDFKKSRKHQELEKKLEDARQKHLQISQNYYDGKASAEEVEAILEQVNNIQDEWRKTLTTLKLK